jgi:hypothetical protein
LFSVFQPWPSECQRDERDSAGLGLVLDTGWYILKDAILEEETVGRTKQMLSAFGLLLSAGVSAYATSVDFTFDTQTINGTTITGLAGGANSAAIQTYMDAVLTASGCVGCTATVLVSGSNIGAVVDQSYNGDGHATGPGNGSQSLTLGDSTGATASNTGSTLGSTDSFIANTNDSSGTVSNQITIQFHNITNLDVTSFAYEIFPDGTCTKLASGYCGSSGSGTPSGYANQPDLKFEAGNNTNGTDANVTTIYGVTPGTTNGTATHSPNSGSSSAETAPQAIGTWTGSLTGDTELDFVDWPATIGIDNLQISYTTPAVPEPSAIVLFGTLVLFLGRKLRKA